MKVAGKKKADLDADNKARVVAVRQQWYRDVGDGLYFKEQRGEVASGTWKQAVATMKAANPYD